MNETTEDFHNPESEAANKDAKLEEVIDAVKGRLSVEELQKVKAILLFGSRARGETRESADYDIHIDVEPYDPNIVQTIIKIFQEHLSDDGFSFNAKGITAGGRTARLITAQKHSATPAAWKYLYSRSESDRLALDEILTSTQDGAR